MTTDIVKRGNTDPDATEIGELYARARGSMVDAVRQAIACGEKLIAKKKTFAHGHWSQWLQANAEVLGFGERTARMLMKAASNRQLASDLDNTTALAISRKIWGHAQPQEPKEPKPKRIPFTDPMSRSEQQRVIEQQAARIAELDEEIDALRETEEITEEAHEGDTAGCSAVALITALRNAVRTADISDNDWEAISEQCKQEIDKQIEAVRAALSRLMEMRLAELEQRTTRKAPRARKSGDNHQVGRSGQPGAGA
ncbi:DUF3102 domain-containing protein [Bradyrhizobium sp. CSA207]|uniref:hypothetical protein n=1 Tax=Bradyrhizobium sp. CSA207 TaxID=2698826 RepID=UPI0023B11861|nr:hypothetical protein [Bradyrhizobium sp. CSA207]MDE5446478.1 DUF3102 domain-containing protein [Bradyrhizobium sp. CSA207]